MRDDMRIGGGLVSPLFLTHIDDKLDLIGNGAHLTKDKAITLHPAKMSVGQAMLLSPDTDETSELPECVPGSTGEEVMSYLILQASVKPVYIGRTVKIHGGTENLAGEGFMGTEKLSGHAKVGHGDLNMDDARDSVGEVEVTEHGGTGGKGVGEEEGVPGGEGD